MAKEVDAGCQGSFQTEIQDVADERRRHLVPVHVEHAGGGGRGDARDEAGDGEGSDDGHWMARMQRQLTTSNFYRPHWFLIRSSSITNVK
jgi:hypothetical protein